MVPNGDHKRGLKPFDRYPQLQYRYFKKEYRRINDAFIGHIIRLIARNFERRVSHSVRALLREYAFLYIQFPKFTYIRAQGFTE